MSKSVRSVAINKPTSWLADFGQLIKFRLTLLVVITALGAALIATRGAVDLLTLLLLGVGGFSITSAANALNEILEKDFDRLMTRTAQRPLATGRMQVNSALLIAGLLFVVGILLLALFNPLASLLGATSVVLYAFLYTPLKRITPFSVFVGAIPGALPMMIGVVALEGRLTYLALVLFAIQFFWQFPHFWSIGFLGFEDYRKAGYKLVPMTGDVINRSLGWQCLIFSLFLVPCCLAPAMLGEIAPWSSGVAILFSLIYSWYSWRLHVRFDRESARNLMFCSFFYLPLILLTFYLGTTPWS